MVPSSSAAALPFQQLPGYSLGRMGRSLLWRQREKERERKKKQKERERGKNIIKCLKWLLFLLYCLTTNNIKICLGKQDKDANIARQPQSSVYNTAQFVPKWYTGQMN